MSNLNVSLRPAVSQLPVNVYFDEALFEKEQATIFESYPRYLAAEVATPEVGDYYALPQEQEGRVLMRTEQGMRLLSNVCRHRQAIMLRGRGHVDGNVVCPIHRWTYSTEGELLGAPHFAENPCLHLNNYRIQNWNGLLFEARGRDVAQDLRGFSHMQNFDFSSYRLGHVEHHECQYNWKTFIEVYLEDYHVVPFHPGLGKFVSCDDLRWQFEEQFSVQSVGIHRQLSHPGSRTYQRWHEQVKQAYGEATPEFGAIWMCYYPTVMLEWYPKVLTVSTLHPLTPQKTLNVVEFYYPEEIVAFEPDFIEAQRAAYMETCIEDDEIAERMDAGRAALHARHDNEVGPYQSPMEDGMQHFHEWYRQVMSL